MPRDATVIPLHRPLPAPAFELGCWVKDRSDEKGEVIGINYHPLTGRPHGYFVRQSLVSVYRFPHELQPTTVPLHVAAGMAPMRLEPPHARPVQWWRRRPGYGTAAVVALGLASFVVWGIVA